MRRCVAAVLVVALATSAQAQSVLKRGNHQDPASLDPHRISTVYENNIVLDLFEGLVTVDAAGVPVPGVAESWTTSSDGLVWTFKLRENLMWSDGHPLTAEDVVYSFRRLMDPGTASQYPHLFYVVANGEAVNTGQQPLTDLGVTALDAASVAIKLTAPAPYLPELLSNGFAAIVPRHVIEDYGGDWTQPGSMVSNGAFTLVDWQPQVVVRMARNENYRSVGTVSLDRVDYFPTEDQSAALARFRAGELNTNLEFPTARTDWLKQNLADETRIADHLITFYLSFNTRSGPLSDVRVRRALALAIDRQTLAERVLRSGERPAYTFVPPYVAGYTPPTSPLQGSWRDEHLATAKALLNEAGYGPGRPLSLTYILSSAEDRRRVAAALSAMWMPLGVEVELSNTEGRVLFSRLRSGDFEIGYAGWAADVNDAANFLGILHSQATNSNYAGFNNAHYDDLLDQAAVTADPDARRGLLAQAESILLSQAPITPLFHGVSKNLVARYVTGWLDNPRDIHLSRYLNIDCN